MQFYAILALFAVAMAAPYGPKPVPYGPEHGPNPECKPPAYRCKPDLTGWLVYGVNGRYLDGGSCPLNTTCQHINNLPYCIDEDGGHSGGYGGGDVGILTPPMTNRTKGVSEKKGLGRRH
ncbi:hypothetical protein GGS23DRAFT_551508 [Durotheca rogersii]|uniref:uncharacterized protein n=1 Tax=Durotheca rogersii TaxID=419775 RepID=UPI0022202614|nr:uncharacterized protein GGS23DRAFT_551508 [Durotheca rogersii]KAI5866668.1 hypothetical protein GGS23DRAFT_551508 [Durotheca rogersii]